MKILFALVFASLGACQMEPVSFSRNTLPPVSSQGFNTMGCMVNDTLLLPEPFGGGIGIGGSVSNGEFYLEVENKSLSAVLTLRAYEVWESGVYDLETIHCAQQPCTTYSNGQYTYEVTDGELLISRLDEQLYIVAGEFDFSATEIRSGRELRVTQGRFDIKYSDF